MSRKHQRKSAAQKDALLPSIEPSEVKESLRLSAAQKDTSLPPVESGTIEKPLQMSTVQKDSVTPVKTKPKSKKNKVKPEGTAGLTLKKPCNSCND